jgi:MFS family permease
VLITRTALGEEVFAKWGWRIPFLFSAFLLAISLWIRLRLHESPVFAKMRAEGRRSEHPYRESFAHWPNVKLVLLALFGIMIAQGAVWYTTFFYGQSFLEGMIKVDPKTTNALMLFLTAISVPMYLFFGWLSDRIGRKPVMLAGIVIMLIAYFPAFHMLEKFGNPALSAAQEKAPVSVVADPADCNLQFDPVGKAQFASSCDIAKSILAKQGVSYTNKAAPGASAQVQVGSLTVPSPGGLNLPKPELGKLRADTTAKVTAALREAGYPAKAEPTQTNAIALFLVLLVLCTGATALYGPQAAALVEMFPARVRYTALSLPYHIGTGWIGGFLPAAAFAIVTTQGDIYAGLWYPFIFTAISAVVMLFFLKETRGRPLEDTGAAPDGPVGPG